MLAQPAFAQVMLWVFMISCLSLLVLLPLSFFLYGYTQLRSYKVIQELFPCVVAIARWHNVAASRSVLCFCTTVTIGTLMPTCTCTTHACAWAHAWACMHAYTYACSIPVRRVVCTQVLAQHTQELSGDQLLVLEKQIERQLSQRLANGQLTQGGEYADDRRSVQWAIA